MKDISKMNNACIRVLDTATFFMENNASLADLIKYFQSKDTEKKIYTNVAMFKYLNTMRVFGFGFKKLKDKYVMESIPYKIVFSKDDLQALHLIQKSAKEVPEKEAQKIADNWIRKTLRHATEADRKEFEKLSSEDVNSPNKFSKLQDKIWKAEEFCTDKQKVKIKYFDINNEEKISQGTPKELRYEDNQVFLRIFNPVYGNVIDINLNCIIETEQLPNISQANETQGGVTFELKNKLAKRYKPREYEEIQDIKANGNVVVLNKNEDQDLLIRRLLRYDHDCEVISPKYFREKMKSTIDKMLDLYR